jgi:2'-5' RNA ligase
MAAQLKPTCLLKTRSGSVLPEAAVPLILTLRLDAAAQGRFDAERAAHFPPERNYLSAHLTLFHHLPSAAAEAIGNRLRAVCESQPCFALEVHDLWMMGRGVAYRLRSLTLARLHAGLAEIWRDWLTPQDRQPLRPHVTIQNKAGAEQARALHDRLRTGFIPFEAHGTGLLLWHYRGGPWEPSATYPFFDA